MLAGSTTPSGNFMLCAGSPLQDHRIPEAASVGLGNSTVHAATAFTSNELGVKTTLPTLASNVRPVACISCSIGTSSAVPVHWCPALGDRAPVVCGSVPFHVTRLAGLGRVLNVDVVRHPRWDPWGTLLSLWRRTPIRGLWVGVFGCGSVTRVFALAVHSHPDVS